MMSQARTYKFGEGTESAMLLTASYRVRARNARSRGSCPRFGVANVMSRRAASQRNNNP